MLHFARGQDFSTSLTTQNDVKPQRKMVEPKIKRRRNLDEMIRDK